MIPQPTQTFVRLGSLEAAAPQPAKALFHSVSARYEPETSPMASHDPLHEVGSPWPTGRLVELSGQAAAGARTTAAVREVVRLQREGELVAWIQTRGGTFYPPDAAESGVDLASLTVVHVPSSALDAARAAELLLRSGAFGLVLVDLEGMVDARLPSRALARLHALCRQHDSTVVFLTPPAQEALGSLVSLRLEPRRMGAHAKLVHELVLDDSSENDASENDASESTPCSEPLETEERSTRRHERSPSVDPAPRRPREHVLLEHRPLELHVVESEVRRDKIGHAPARSLHRGPLGLTKHDEVVTQAGVVLPFRRRTSDDATLPLPFFEARDAG